MVIFDINPLTALIEFFLPFIAIFILLYSLLQKGKVLGDPQNITTKRMHAVFSLVIAILVIFYSPVNIGQIFAQIFRTGSIALIGVIFFAFFTLLVTFGMGKLDPRTGMPAPNWTTVLIGALLAFIAMTISGALGVFEFPEIWYIFKAESIAVIIAVLLLLTGLYYLFKMT